MIEWNELNEKEQKALIAFGEAMIKLFDVIVENISQLIDDLIPVLIEIKRLKE